MFKLLTKQILLLTLIVLVIWAIIFGSYLPLIKSRRFISALGSLSLIKTIEQFKTFFNRSLNFYSPIGDEEVTKFLVSDILSFVSDDNQSESGSRMLVDYIEPRIFQDDVRHLLAMAQIYWILWEKYGYNEADFEKAENYFKKAYVIGPKLPPVLYGMFDFYKAKGDVVTAKEIGEEILNYWPNDEEIENYINSR
ncbi:hypothetical protein JW698_01960 [Candidatus Wolfebacteria bacterium]|nr:hypothetical protein [Candidatus Wolfebacteria bacterium]